MAFLGTKKILALHQDAGKVARELGNSAGVLLRHYTELVDRSVALDYWEQEELRMAAGPRAGRRKAMETVDYE